MKLTATVIWSTSVQLELPDDATDEQQREAILTQADKDLPHLDFKHPVIHDCSNMELID